VGADPGGDPARTAPGKLLDEHGVSDGIGVAPVLDWELQPDVPKLCEPAEDLVRKPARVLPLTRVGTQLGLDEAPDGLAEFFVFSGERRDRTTGGGTGRAGLGGKIGGGHGRAEP
jgi:hypothetical protein